MGPNAALVSWAGAEPQRPSQPALPGYVCWNLAATGSSSAGQTAFRGQDFEACAAALPQNKGANKKAGLSALLGRRTDGAENMGV